MGSMKGAAAATITARGRAGDGTSPVRGARFYSIAQAAPWDAGERQGAAVGST